jgi:FtsP/CotA-like multicopper oxidase with cupredoxin domain
MIEADGTPLTPITVHTFPIHVAQRYSFILETNQTATSYWIRAVMNTNCFNQDNPQLNPDVFAILQYNTTAVSIPNTTAWDNTMDTICHDLNLTELVPLNPVLPLPQADSLFRIDISFQTRQADLNYGFLNSTTWVPLNGSDVLEKASAQTNISSIQGIDSAFPISNQLVYAIPNIQTVEYCLISKCSNIIVFY